MAESPKNAQDARYRRWRWQVFSITWLAYVGYYLTRKSFAVAKVELARPEVMGIAKSEMAWMDGAYLTLYAIGQFVWGMCGDRFGTRQVVLAGMVASVICGIGMGLSSITLIMGVLFCLQGVAQSTGWAPLSKNICNFFSQSERGRIMGAWATNYAIGGVIASALAGFAIEWAGQRRLAEYNTGQETTVAQVLTVAERQGYDEPTARAIHGYLQIAHASQQSLQEATQILNSVVQDPQQNLAVRESAIRGLISLDQEVASTSTTQLPAELRELANTLLAQKSNEAPPSVETEDERLIAVGQDSLQQIWGILGWRYAFFAPAAALFAIAVLFFVLQRNRPTDLGLPPIEKYRGEPEAKLTGKHVAGADEGSWQFIWQVATNRMVLLLSAVYFLMKPTRYLILFWSPLYVNERLGSGAVESGILGSMFELAGPISVLLGGVLSDKVFGSRRMPVSVLSLFLVAAVLFVFHRLPATPLAIGLGFFAIGFLLYMPDSLVSATAAIDFGTRKGAATASGMINGFGSIGAIVGGIAPGVLEKMMGPGVDIWPYVFPALGASLILAALLLLPHWNTLPAVSESHDEESKA